MLLSGLSVLSLPPPPPPPLPMVELFVRWKFGPLIFKAREGGKEGRKEEYGATVRFLWGSHSFLSPADSAVFSLFSRYISKIANCPPLPAPPPSRPIDEIMPRRLSLYFLNSNAHFSFLLLPTWKQFFPRFENSSCVYGEPTAANNRRVCARV